MPLLHTTLGCLLLRLATVGCNLVAARSAVAEAEVLYQSGSLQLTGRGHAVRARQAHLRHGGQQAECEATLVFNLGLPRTGTRSTSDFLRLLGMKSVHIFDPPYDQVRACYNRSSDCGFFREAGAGSASVAFADIPTFGLGCALAEAYPEARFLLPTRPFESYFPSVRFMLCSWTKGLCNRGVLDNSTVEKHDHFRIQELFYEDAFGEWCRFHALDSRGESLCTQDEQHEGGQWDKVGLTDLWRRAQLAHDTELRACLPKDRLLELNVDEPDTEKAALIHSFLGCSGKVPSMPRIGKVLS